LAQNFWLVYYFVLKIELKMAQVFNWNRPGYEPVTFKWEWNVKVPFLKTTDGNGEKLISPLFSPEETPNSKWELDSRNQTGGYIEIGAYHHNSSAGNVEEFVEPAQVKMSILDNKGTEVFQQISPTSPCYFWGINLGLVKFHFSKEEIMKSKCQQSDGSLTFSCQIVTHIKKGTHSRGLKSGHL
jgi:hypothetical protein